MEERTLSYSFYKILFNLIYLLQKCVSLKMIIFLCYSILQAFSFTDEYQGKNLSVVVTLQNQILWFKTLATSSMLMSWVIALTCWGTSNFNIHSCDGKHWSDQHCLSALLGWRQTMPKSLKQYSFFSRKLMYKQNYHKNRCELLHPSLIWWWQ